MSLTMRTVETENGLRVIAEEDHTSPAVGVVAVVGAGSSSDPPGKEGLAHFVEHLAFRSKPDSKSRLSTLLARVGAGTFNAHTSLDTTTYYEFGPPESLESLLALEGARLLDPLANVDSQTFDVEREVVRNELRLRNETGYHSQLLSWAQSAVFPASHPYSRPLIGTHESLSSITLQDARDFVAMHYRPDNIILIVVGDLSILTILEVLDRALPPQLWQAATPSAPRARAEVTAPPNPAGGELQRLAAPVPTPRLLIAWGLPRSGDEDNLFIEAVVKLLNSALWRVEDDDVSSVETGVLSGKDGSLLICEVLLKQGAHPEQSAERILNEIQLSTRYGRATALRYNQLRFGAHARLVYELEDMQRRAVFLSRTAFFSKPDQAYTRAVRALERIGVRELLRFNERYLSAKRARIAYVVPSKGEAAEDDADERTTVQAEDDQVRVLYPAEAIRSIMHPLPAQQFQTLQLKNGLEVIIARRAAWPLVTIELAVRGGRATAQPRGAADLAQLATPRRRGAHGYPADYGIQIRERLDEEAMFTQVEAGSANLEVALAILSDNIQRLRVQESTLSEFRKRHLPLLERLERTPKRRAARAFWEALFPAAQFAGPATAQELGSLKSEEVERWLEQAYSPGNSVLAIVGDIDPIETPKAVERWLGDWEAARPRENKSQVRMVSLKNPAERKSVLVTNRRGATQAEIQLGCPSQADAPKDALSYQILGELLAEALSGSARERLGATYGFHASAGAPQEVSPRIVVSGAVDNGSFSRVIALIREHWPKVSVEDLSAQSINRIRWDIARRYNLQYTTSPALADAIARTRIRGWSPELLERFPELLLDLTPDDVKTAAINCEKGAVLSIVGDEKVINSALKGLQSTP